MNLRDRNSIPMISKDGMNTYPLSEYENLGQDEYKHVRTEQTIKLLNTLKESCSFSTSGIVEAFSCFSSHFKIEFRIGEIQKIPIPEAIENNDFVIISSDKYTAIQGDINKNECVFPHFQFTSNEIINITCAAFPLCPKDFTPEVLYHVNFARKTEDPAIELLHKSIWELSQNNSNLSIVLLYASIEIAVEKITKLEKGKISCRMHKHAKVIEDKEPNLAKILNNLKKGIENNIVKRRGEFAHKGKHLNQSDLLKSFEVAVEFFWHYESLKSTAIE